MGNYFIVGVTGNFGTGKSQFCKFIEEKGFPVIYSDALAKKIIAENHQVRSYLIKEFGEEAFINEGSFNTKYISSIVFANTEQAKQKLLRLNSIIHPFVIEEIQNEIERQIQKGHRLIFVESSLIYEVGLEDAFDFIILITCTKSKIFERAKTKNKLMDQEIQARLNVQIEDKQKKELADFVVYNDSSLDHLKQNAYLILEIIQAFLQGENEQSEGN